MTTTMPATIVTNDLDTLRDHLRPYVRVALAFTLSLSLGCADDDAEPGPAGPEQGGDTGDSGDIGDTGDSGDTIDDQDSSTDTGLPGEEPPAPLELEPSTPPIDVPAGVTFYEDVQYGDDPRFNAFDIFVPESDAPTPLILYIHGGGFDGGDKRSAYVSSANEIRQWLSEGVAFATINYRLLEHNDPEGVIKPLSDSRYCLQFIRYHAASLNIAPERVALFGGSAGAGTSLWIGASPDMADPMADDPVEQMSTRVSAVGARATQATYDLVRWETDVFIEYGTTFEDLTLTLPELTPLVQSFYALGERNREQTLAALYSPEIEDYRQSVDILAMLDSDDPPIWIESTGGAGADLPPGPPENTGALYHHPNHGREVREAAMAAGIPVVANLPALGIVDDEFPSLVEFMLDAVQ
ncbi:MAG: carboxylesterase family protein [Myxococcota bacterium]